MRAKQYQDVEPRLLSQSQAERYTGLGRAVFTEWAIKINARRTFGRRVLYDKKVIDRALNEMFGGDEE